MRSGTTLVLGIILIILFGFPALLASAEFLPYCGMRVEGLPESRYNSFLEKHMAAKENYAQLLEEARQKRAADLADHAKRLEEIRSSSDYNKLGLRRRK